LTNKTGGAIMSTSEGHKPKAKYKRKEDNTMKNGFINLSEIEKKISALDFPAWEIRNAIPENGEIEYAEIAQTEEVIFQINQLLEYLEDSKKRLNTAIFWQRGY
jgi:hypothetical protein